MPSPAMRTAWKPARYAVAAGSPLAKTSMRVDHRMAVVADPIAASIRTVRHGKRSDCGPDAPDQGAQVGCEVRRP